MNVFAYIRVSGRSQIVGEGPDRQRDECNQFCAANKLTKLGEYFDAHTGTVADRPAFTEMMVAIESRRANGEQIDGIVIERMDRIARDLMVSELLLGECRKAGLRVFSTDHGLVDIASNDGDPTRILIRQLMAAIAEFEKSQMVIKLRKAREAIKKETGYCGGAKPYGKNAQEKAILTVLHLFVQPDTPLAEVADLLNREGFPTRAGGTWTAKSAWRLLKQTGMHTPKMPARKENNGRSVSST